jgi:hypothetical protein
MIKKQCDAKQVTTVQAKFILQAILDMIIKTPIARNIVDLLSQIFHSLTTVTTDQETLNWSESTSGS